MDTNELLVCSNCKKFGKEVKIETPREPVKFIPKPRYTAPPKEKFYAPILIKNFGSKIKSAREKRGLTIKELGEKIYEKESLLHKIEGSKIRPTMKAIEKLEKFLNISLTEEYNEVKLEEKESQGGMTLEDLLDKKLKKK